MGDVPVGEADAAGISGSTFFGPPSFSQSSGWVLYRRGCFRNSSESTTLISSFFYSEIIKLLRQNKYSAMTSGVSESALNYEELAL